MVCTLYGRDICKTLDRLVCKYRQRTTLGNPRVVLNPFLCHRLFHHYDSIFLKPENFIQGLFPVFPSLVGVDSQRKVCDFADGADHFLVVVKSDLYLQYIESVCTFACLLANDVRSVDAYCECSVRCLGRVQSPDSPPWLSHELSYKIMKGDVYRCLGCIVSRREAVHIGKYLFKTERVLELTKIDAGEE